jgi:hypothetical protein
MDIEAHFRGMLVGREELDGLAREALRTVRRNLERPRKALPAGMLVLARRDQLPLERVAIILGEFDEEEKVRCYRAAGAKFAGTGLCPMACVMFAEAWMVTSADKEPDVAPKDHPARKEVVVIAGGALGGVHNGKLFLAHQTAGILNVSRNNKGRLVAGTFSDMGTKGEFRLVLEFFNGWASALVGGLDPERN